MKNHSSSHFFGSPEMDFWTRLLVAGTLLSRIPLPIQTFNSNHRMTGWSPWIGRSLVLKHPFDTSKPVDTQTETETETPPMPTAVTGLPLPQFSPVSHPLPVPVYVQPMQPMQHRVGVIAPNWFVKGPPVSTPQVSRTSKSFLEKAITFLPSLFNLLGFGSTTNPKSKAAFDELFRMFGIESSSVGVLAMNLLVFVAEKYFRIAGRFLPTDGNDVVEGRGFKDTKLFGLNLPSQEKISAITNALADNQLTEKISAITNALADNQLTEKVLNNMALTNGNKTACQQKLICKLSPFVKGMQRYLFNRNVNQHQDNEIHFSKPWTTRLYNALPSLLDYKSTSDNCDTRYPQCLY
uniref:Uncharacterized protein n=1 Tax=Strigamia maritima TaxID=126957 RepID=T1IMM7_STRMM